MVRRLLLLCSAIGLLGACIKSPKITVPSYIQVDSIKTVTSYSLEGTNNQKFSDLLVESKTYNYGYYPMPGKIPLPLTGATYLIVRPVIKVNGVGALRVDYPLMHGYDTTFGLIPGQAIKITPVFKYYPTVNFRFMGDFEGGTQMVNSDAANTFGVKQATNANYPGSQMPGSTKCLLMRLDADHPVCQTQSYTTFSLPTDGTNIFLEINYKSNTDFEVGLIGTNTQNGPISDQRTVGGANASNGWNKMYFSFSQMVATPPHYPWYYLYFSKSGYDASSDTNFIFIDNIKVISQN